MPTHTCSFCLLAGPTYPLPFLVTINQEKWSVVLNNWGALAIRGQHAIEVAPPDPVRDHWVVDWLTKSPAEPTVPVDRWPRISRGRSLYVGDRAFDLARFKRLLAWMDDGVMWYDAQDHFLVMRTERARAVLMTRKRMR